jgi:hypothetical protein
MEIDRSEIEKEKEGDREEREELVGPANHSPTQCKQAELERESCLVGVFL